MGRMTAKANHPLEVRFAAGRSEQRRSLNELWRESQTPNPAWLVGLLDLSPVAICPLSDQRTGANERRVEFGLARAAVLEIAPRLLEPTIRRAQTDPGSDELRLCLTFSPAALPLGLSLSLGRTAHTGEQFWQALEFVEYGAATTHDLWADWRALISDDAHGRT